MEFGFSKHLSDKEEICNSKIEKLILNHNENMKRLR